MNMIIQKHTAEGSNPKFTGNLTYNLTNIKLKPTLQNFIAIFDSEHRMIKMIVNGVLPSIIT